MPESQMGAMHKVQNLVQLKRLMLPVPTLAATDSVSRALHLMARSQASVLPVVAGTSLVAVVAEVDLLVWIIRQRGSLGFLDPDKAHDAMVMQVMTSTVAVGYAEETLDTVLPLFEERRLKAIPVLDTLDRYQGMLTRQSVLDALTHQAKPPHIAGLATFWGIRLSNGVTHTGVPDRLLLAHGALLAWILLLAHALAHAVLPKVGPWYLAFFPVFVCIVALLGVMRFSSWSGYHAAEHQVMTAIERTETLTPETVRAMPRIHADCEARVTILAGLLTLLLSFATLDARVAVALLTMAWLGQHRMALWLQRHIATRPASWKQIVHSVAVATQLLRGPVLWPDVPTGWWQRLWHQGVLSMASGGAIAWIVWMAVGLSRH